MKYNRDLSLKYFHEIFDVSVHYWCQFAILNILVLGILLESWNPWSWILGRWTPRILESWNPLNSQNLRFFHDWTSGIMKSCNLRLWDFETLGLLDSWAFGILESDIGSPGRLDPRPMGPTKKHKKGSHFQKKYDLGKLSSFPENVFRWGHLLENYFIW